MAVASLHLLLKWPAHPLSAKKDYPPSMKAELLERKIVSFTATFHNAVDLKALWEEWSAHHRLVNPLLGAEGRVLNRAMLEVGATDANGPTFSLQDREEEATAAAAKAKKYTQRWKLHTMPPAEQVAAVQASRVREDQFLNCVGTNQGPCFNFELYTGTNAVVCLACGERLYISHEENEERGTGIHKRIVYRTAALRECEGGKMHMECFKSVEMMMGNDAVCFDSREFKMIPLISRLE